MEVLGGELAAKDGAWAEAKAGAKDVGLAAKAVGLEAAKDVGLVAAKDVGLEAAKAVGLVAVAKAGAKAVAWAVGLEALGYLKLKEG